MNEETTNLKEEEEFLEQRKNCQHEPGNLNYMQTDYVCKKCGADCECDV